MTFGVDVSSNNHPSNTPINYDVAVTLSGVTFAYVKATEGTTYRNLWRGIDGRGFAARGIDVGYYHFARPTQGDPISQADYFLASIGDLPHTLPMVLDLEDGAAMGWDRLATWAELWLSRVEGQRYDTCLYVNRYYLSRLPGAPWGRKLWFASPGPNPPPECWVWQYGQGFVNGFTGMVDLNRLLGVHPAQPSGDNHVKLNTPVVGPAVFTPSGGGYWIITADGGIFAFGDAEPFGNGDPLPSQHLNAPITGAARSPGGHGLLLVAADGGTFSFGDCPNYGSIPGLSG